MTELTNKHLDDLGVEHTINLANGFYIYRPNRFHADSKPVLKLEFEKENNDSYYGYCVEENIPLNIDTVEEFDTMMKVLNVKL